MTETFDTIIVAAGSGTRLGFSMPKAFVPLGGIPLLEHSINAFIAHPLLAHLIIVVPESLVTSTAAQFLHKLITIVAGGKERWESVRNGLDSCTADWVLVHDAARPFVTRTVIDALVDKQTIFDCAITATPVVDTIRTFTNDIAGATIDRSTLIRVGTPQLFRTELLRKAFEQPIDQANPPTDEAMLLQNMGVSVGIAEGDPKNFKITTKEDFEMAESLIKFSQSPR